MNETIDATQFLPRDVPLVNKYRMAKGDIDGRVEGGKIINVRVVDETVARNLITRGFLEEFHVAYGLDLMELRNALYGQLNARPNFGMFLMMGDCSLKKRHAQEVYSLVVKEIGASGVRIIGHALTVEYSKDAAAKTISGLTVYRQIFECMTKAMDSAIEKVRSEMEKELA